MRDEIIERTVLRWGHPAIRRVRIVAADGDAIDFSTRLADFAPRLVGVDRKCVVIVRHIHMKSGADLPQAVQFPELAFLGQPTSYFGGRGPTAQTGAYVTFGGRLVEVRVGISFVSLANARRNPSGSPTTVAVTPKDSNRSARDFTSARGRSLPMTSSSTFTRSFAAA